MAGRGINKAILVGNLGGDPELRYTASGDAVANFTMATGEVWTDKDGNKQDRPEWHRIVAWRKLAEICGEYLKKGSQVYVEGKIRTRSWEDKDGVKKYTTEIQAENIVMLGRKSEEEGIPPSPPPEKKEFESEDDLPF